MQILVVDDDDDARVYLERALKKHGHEVVTAPNGLKALAISEESPPDMIVSDILMPEMDGFTLCLRLKSDSKLKDIPIVFYTATYTDQDSVNLAMKMGASGYLLKPLEHSELVDKLIDTLAEHRSRGPRTLGEPQQPFDGLERKWAELIAKKLDEKVVELKEGRENFKRIFETMRDGYLSANTDGNILLANSAAVRILGYDTESELIGRNIAEDLYASPDSGEELKALLRENHAVEGIETELKKKTGEVIIVDADSQLLLDADGKPEAVETLFRDITERKSLEKQLLRSQRMEAVGQLTGGIAHDFNNLLSVVVGNAESLKKKVGDDEESRGEVEKIINVVSRGTALIQRLLAFSRQQRLSPRPTAINELVSGLEELLHRTLGETVELHTRLGARVGDALIDPHQFENALVNLAINARDAMAKGGKLEIETAHVTLDDAYARLHEDVTPGEYVKIAVRDTGAGISPDVLAKVFEPFFTTKDVGKGSGLGLSMVYGFAKQSGGHVTIQSKFGKGTTVDLYLPRASAGVERIETTAKSAKTLTGSERILVVEDDKDVRDIPVTVLRDHGYVVAEASHGQEAIKLLQDAQPFELLFTDVALLGGMNGLELAKAARQLQPNIKILYTTGHARDTISQSGRLDPDAPLINKPYGQTELLEQVRNTLDMDDS